MPDTLTCPHCEKKVGSEDIYCRYCGADIAAVVAGSKEEVSGSQGAVPLDDEEPRQGEEDFSALDYRPQKKAGCLVPALVIILVLFITAAGLFYLRGNYFWQADDDQPLDVPIAEEQVEDLDPDGAEEEVAEVDPDGEEEKEEEPEGNDEAEPPDYEQLEAVLEEWLEGRMSEPDVIMVHTDELDNIDQFYELYDPQEDTVIVYKIESKDDQFVTAVFGLPYSEWSLKAIFNWRDGQWVFLREESIL